VKAYALGLIGDRIKRFAIRQIFSNCFFYT